MSTNLERATQVLIAHQRKDIASCMCGWSKLGESHSQHQAEQLSHLLRLDSTVHAGTKSLVAAYVSQLQRFWHANTRGIATLEQRQQWEAEAEAAIAHIRSQAAITTLTNVREVMRSTGQDTETINVLLKLAVDQW